MGRINLTGDYGLAALGVCFDPITISAAMAVVGSVVTAAGTIAGGNAAKSSAYSQALQMDQQATQARASSQRTMFEHQRQTDLTQSQLQSRAAASGAGAQDEGVIKLGSDIAGRGEEQSLMDLYNGENTARGLEDSATAKRASGDAAKTGSMFSAAGSLISGIGSGFAKYGAAPSSPISDRSFQ